MSPEGEFGHPKLVARLEVELSQLEQLMEKAGGIVGLNAQTEANLTETFAAGALLHAFYNGAENLFKRIAKDLDGSLPSTASWHRELLRQMSTAQGGRGPTISTGLEESLAPYLDFRHAFRNIYSHELKWSKLRPLLAELRSVHAKLANEIKNFISNELLD